MQEMPVKRKLPCREREIKGTKLQHYPGKRKEPGKFPYCITDSVSLVILLTFATNAVIYICSSMANSPLESALRNPWASFNSPFFSSIRCRIFIRSLKYSLSSNFSLSRFFSLAWVML